MDEAIRSAITQPGKHKRPWGVDAGDLLHALRDIAGIPCGDVSMGKMNDRSTWKVEFLPETTEEHKRLAAEIIEAIHPEYAPPFEPPLSQEELKAVRLLLAVKEEIKQ